jgi:broad specificity polyphosphatase/5'/3'-nucleotidase SurE
MSVTPRINLLLLSFFVAAGASAVSAPASANGLNILLTNDDGYGSYGITAMQAALEGAGHTVYISAPATEQSGKSGSANTDFGAIIDFTEEVAGEEWSVEGTPADSVSAGLFGLTPDVLPEGEVIDLVVSGVNDGENISRFVNISGTVGAAMFALRRGYSVLAVSAGQDIPGRRQLGDCFDPSEPPCTPQEIGAIFQAINDNAEEAADNAAALTVAVIDELGEEGIPDGLGLNINVPSGRFSTAGTRVTKSDNDQGFDLVIVKNDDGELEVDALVVNQILAGLLGGDINPASCPFLPSPIRPDLDSEGAAFSCAYNTIATFNGNFDSSQDDTDQSKDLACSLEGIATMPSFFNCDGGDGPKNK